MKNHYVCSTPAVVAQSSALRHESRLLIRHESHMKVSVLLSNRGTRSKHAKMIDDDHSSPDRQSGSSKVERGKRKSSRKEEQETCQSNVYMLYGNQKNQAGICVTEQSQAKLVTKNRSVIPLYFYQLLTRWNFFFFSWCLSISVSYFPPDLCTEEGC